MDRFIAVNEICQDSYQDFFNYTLRRINLKIEELKTFNKGKDFDNESFVYFVKNELTIAKTDFLEEVITQEDFLKYYQ